MELYTVLYLPSFTQHQFLDHSRVYYLVLHSLLLMVDFPCINIPQFIHSPIDGRLDCFQFGAIMNMNKLAVNIHEQIFVQTYFHL